MRTGTASSIRGSLTSCALFCAVTLALVAGCSPADQSTASKAVSSSSAAAAAFDQDRAFSLLEKQVNLGPRVPGTLPHDEAAKLIEAELKSGADRVQLQDFAARVDGKAVPMRNIIGYFRGRASKWVLLAAHWDTRPIADMEVEASKKSKPIPGANDGASGVAVLLELARAFSAKRPDVGVVMVFFDGEDYGQGEERMFLGSKHFADHLDELSVDGDRVRISYGVLLDMVGDKNLGIYQERSSVEAAPEVVDKVWNAAQKLGYKQFHPEVRYSIADDHIPLIKRGVKCIDVIDFDYAPWHTLDDTPDKCSPGSLKAVGDVVGAVVYTER